MAIRRIPRKPGWYVEWWEGGRGSKRHSKKFDTKSAAVAFDAKIKLEKAKKGSESPIVSPLKMMIGDLADEFLDWVETYLSKNTLAFYQDRLKAVFKVIRRETLITKLKPQIRLYVSERRGAVDNGTVNKELKTLKRLMSFAVEQGYLEYNPLTGLKYLPENKAEKIKKRRIYEKEQVRKFLEHTPHERRAMFLLFFGMGLRKSEVYNLKWEDINFESRRLYVVGKGGKLRTLFIPPKILQALRHHPKKAGSEYVFPGRDGGPTKSLTNSARKIMKEAGLPRISLHEMRHSFASNMLMEGVDMKSVQETLGHSQISITFDTYSHLTIAHLENTMMVSQEIVAPTDSPSDASEKVISLEFARSRRGG